MSSSSSSLLGEDVKGVNQPFSTSLNLDDTSNTISSNIPFSSSSNLDDIINNLSESNKDNDKVKKRKTMWGKVKSGVTGNTNLNLTIFI